MVGKAVHACCSALLVVTTHQLWVDRDCQHILFTEDQGQVPAVTVDITPFHLLQQCLPMQSGVCRLS
jgi:hypothetical protein